MLLSVLSALARLDIDPWQEAAELAGLPAATATKRLASLIDALPDGPSPDEASAGRDPGTIAARLVALLPRRASVDIPPRKTLLGTGAAPGSPSVIRLIAINVAFMAFLLSAQWIVASRQVSFQAGHPQEPTSTTVPSKIPPPNLGR